MSVFFNDRVAIVRPPLKENRAGETVQDLAGLDEAEGRPWGPVQVRPLSQTEFVGDGRDTAVSQWRIANEHGDVDLLETDWIRLPNGSLARVVGEPARPSDIFSRSVHHVEVVVERARG